jgi:hypothetical protein
MIFADLFLLGFGEETIGPYLHSNLNIDPALGLSAGEHHILPTLGCNCFHFIQGDLT